ncbi:hypothetical protein UPYG_G00136560 [Umbra pygmaea]|uniref:Immunoglobulin V-set domain-containing protein n=1 Tax=Umbra pygmaea TaxID=75934 RepID=A0ABD0WUA7_UMBPY
MYTLLWRCMLGLLCTPAVLTWTASQNPIGLPRMRVNSSADIHCSTSLPNPSGLYLKGRFHGNREVLYLSMNDGAIQKVTTNTRFTDRVTVVKIQGVDLGYELTLRLSQLKVEDTDCYFCSWRYYDTNAKKLVVLPSNGTIIMIREEDPGCDGTQAKIELLLIVFSGTIFLFILLFTIKALVQCTRSKRPSPPARTTSLKRTAQNYC